MAPRRPPGRVLWIVVCLTALGVARAAPGQGAQASFPHRGSHGHRAAQPNSGGAQAPWPLSALSGLWQDLLASRLPSTSRERREAIAGAYKLVSRLAAAAVGSGGPGNEATGSEAYRVAASRRWREQGEAARERHLSAAAAEAFGTEVQTGTDGSATTAATAAAHAGELAVDSAAESAWAAKRAAMALLARTRLHGATDSDREVALHAALLTRQYLQQAADQGDGGADAVAALAALSAAPEVRAYDRSDASSGSGGRGSGAGRKLWSLDAEQMEFSGSSSGSGRGGGGGSDGVFRRRGRQLAADVDELVCSGVGLPASSNATFQECNGTRVTPAVLAAVVALQAAATAGAGDAVLTALEGALLALPGLNVSTLIPRGTPIPAGVNLSALPADTQVALLAAANVSSLANITSFDQIIGADGSIAGGRLNATDLLPLLPVNATLALVQGIRCSESSELLDTCACPLDFRGPSCSSRRSLVASLEVDDPAVRACLETPSDAPLGPGGISVPPGAFGFNGASLLGSGVRPRPVFMLLRRRGVALSALLCPHRSWPTARTAGCGFGRVLVSR